MGVIPLLSLPHFGTLSLMVSNILKVMLMVTLVRDLMKEWNSIGHVPFKEKDKLYKQYHGIIDQLFDRFNINASNNKLSNFRSNIINIQGSSTQSLYREREKQVGNS